MDVAGGFKRTCMELFTEFVNQLPELDPKNRSHVGALRNRQEIIAGIMPGATSLDLSASAANSLGNRIIAEMQTLSPGTEVP